MPQRSGLLTRTSTSRPVRRPRRFPARPDLHRIGLDLETLPQVNWGGPPIWKHVLCVGWGEEADIQYIEAIAMRAGRFHREDLLRVHKDLSAPGALVVGHNVYKADLPTLNGLFVAHDLPELPELRFQDTMNTLKTGYVYRNTLRAQCARYGVVQKMGGPDWDRILQGFRSEWDLMESYNKNDVLCTLQLERALDAAGLSCPIGVWLPRKKARYS